MYASSNPAQGLVQETVSCVGLTVLYFELIVNSTVNTLSGNIVLGVGVTEAASYPGAQAATVVTTAVTGIAFAGGVLTILNPAIGRQVVTYRIANVAKLFKPQWTYLLGGGDWDVRMTVWGIGQGTTP